MIQFRTVSDIVSTTKTRIGKNYTIAGCGVSDGRVEVNTPIGLVACIAIPVGSSGGGMVRPHSKMIFEIEGCRITKKELSERLKENI